MCHLKPVSYFILIALAWMNFSCSEKEKADEHSPETSLKDLKVYDGLEVTLFASEPALTNPTNIDVDSRGRVWVCEAYNYRSKLNPKNPVKAEGDRILILEDTDSDGKADKTTVFYQGTDVNAALGIAVLGNKVIVSCSPNVLVFTDENGDDVPDKKEILFKGIHGEQHDHGMHAFVFGPDGRLYFNFGNEGKVLLDSKGDTVVDIHSKHVMTEGKPFREGLVMRCEPDGSNVEVLAQNFRNNYEVTVDPYGSLWQSDNDDDGNKGTRINFVMEQGNYGYKDYITGASWGARRTNMEKEIPFRHWHLNDPGVIPNLLQTGAGSPTGITVYDGTLLPAVFQGQIIHSDAGPNVVRSYPVKVDGGGYKADIVPILEIKKDQWFRPSDVCVAPDGSLFIADWYDPGVGGHQVGDLERGRIYRVAPPKTNYNIEPVNVSTPDGAATALVSPNYATRYLGWMALQKFDDQGEAALTKLWNGSNTRQRAQALWLLARLPQKGDQYLAEALKDKDENIRITALRATRQLKKDVLGACEALQNDLSAGARREVAIALKGIGDARAAEVWANVALQYAGNDRWYVEALGIGEEGNEDLYFNAWKKKVKDVNTPASRDIVWRSRSKDAMPLMANYIRESKGNDVLRYFRAFDFQKDPSKQKVLQSLLTSNNETVILYALKSMNVKQVKPSPALTAAINKTLAKYKGTIEFVELINTFRLQNKAQDLFDLGVQYPDSTVGRMAMQTLIEWNNTTLIEKALKEKQSDKIQALIKALWPLMSQRKVVSMMERIIGDSTVPLDDRKLAIRTFGGPWNSEDRLIELARDNKIPADLQPAAAAVFMSAWRENIRNDGAKYLKLPGTDGKPLATIADLLAKTGNAVKGKEVFSTYCTSCHAVNKEGVDFGPALSEIGSKLPKEGLYSAIIFPDAGVSFGYEGYQVKLKDGSQAVGIISSETEEQLEVKYMKNVQTIDQNKVESKTKMENSLMPSNLQSVMSEEQLINLVEYLSSLKKK
ncbi:MAG TPA: PVC-type heme-binding CxxCH protein [Cyclobacteriaceae bacterium]